MKLEDAVRELDGFDKNAILCVRRPWSPSAECTVAPPDENLGVPMHVKKAGLEYFMEVYIALEVLSVFEKPASEKEKIELLIYYAENDAYPAWVINK